MPRVIVTMIHLIAISYSLYSTSLTKNIVCLVCFVQTFRPKKKFEPGTLRHSLHKHAQASLNSGINLSDVVKLPRGENLEDWIAVHVVDFFNRLNLIYGTISDYCTEETCPRMSGGAK